MIKKLLIGIVPIAVLGLLTSTQMSDNGKAGRTGSPGESTCTSCHNSFAVNSGAGSITLQCMMMTGFQYTPGQTYNMSVTVAQSGIGLFGVGLEALTSANDNAGTITATDAASTTIKNTTVTGISRHNLVHKLNGGANPDSKAFNFSWTAPAAGTGNVTFYFAGIAANGNGNENGDYVYTSTQVLTEITCQPPLAVITNNGSTLVASPGASYEWYFNGTFIPGATASTYVPTQNGNYVVVVYDAGGCAGTSAVYVYTSVGIGTVANKENQVTVFPNPATDRITFHAPDMFRNSMLTIYDITGQAVRQLLLSGGDNVIDIGGIAEGVYTAVAENENNKSITRILVNK